MAAEFVVVAVDDDLPNSIFVPWSLNTDTDESTTDREYNYQSEQLEEI